MTAMQAMIRAVDCNLNMRISARAEDECLLSALIDGPSQTNQISP